MKLSAVQKNGVKQWRVHYREGEKYRRLFFRSKEKASAFLADLANEKRLHGDAGRSLSPGKRIEYMQAERQLEAVGATLADAVSHFLKTGVKLVRRTVSDAAGECVALKESTGRKPRYVQQLGYSLSYFVRDYGTRDVASVTTAEIQDWLGKQGWAPYTRRNRRIDIGTLFAFAVRRGYALTNPVANVEAVLMDDKPPAILTPGQASQLLEAVRASMPRLLAGVAVMLFAGLRRSEAVRLTWGHVETGRGIIRVDSDTAKTRQRRLVTIQPNLSEWLKLGGDLPVKNHNKALTAAFRLISQDWQHNALRHSFVSYHLAAFGDAGKTALEAGNSPDMVFRHYRELVTNADADAFWVIRPKNLPS